MDRLYYRSPEEYAEKFTDEVALGARLRGARLLKGYTQDEVAHCLNVSRRVVSNWECGDRSIDAITFARLCEVLEIDMYDALVADLGDLMGISDRSIA